MCVPSIKAPKKKILDGGHNTPHPVHLAGNKLCKDLKQTFWWSNMKQEVVDYVVKCLTCQRVKIEHQRPAWLLQPLDVHEWKWDSMSMDFVGGWPLIHWKNNVIWVIMDRLTKTAHFIAMRNTWTLDPISSSITQGDSAVAGGTQFHSVGSGH